MFFMTSPTTSQLLIFLLLLFVSPPGGNAAAAAVLDTKGRPLRANSMYYILPLTQGGGLTMSPINGTTSCPFYVAQENHELFTGLPVWFLPNTKSKKNLILLSSDINILFNEVNTVCLQSAAWKLTIDRRTRRRYVTTGGDIGNPGEDTVKSWFKIEKVGGWFKIMYCPDVCSSCMVMCADVGVLVQNDGTRLLGLTNRSFYVMFKRAKSRRRQYYSSI